MMQNPTVNRMSRLVALVGLTLALALAVPAGTDASSFREVKKLTASDAQRIDFFGYSVAVSGDTAVVGAYLQDAGGNNAGAAYVFRQSQGGTGNWGEVTKLTASDVQASDRFGRRVAISGDTAIVGSFWEDAAGTDAGAAYVFRRDEGGADNWGEVIKLTASDAQTNDRFAVSVAISGDTAVVGAVLEDTGGADAGAVYVFQRDEGGADNWGEVTKLIASDSQTNDRFGGSVAISVDTIIVGAHHAVSGGSFTGAAYVFQRDKGGVDNWGEVKKLTASDAERGDLFGGSVAISGDSAVVGACCEDSGGSAAGAAYVFRRDHGSADNWGEVQKLTASDAEPGAFLGESVTISGDAAVVGAYGQDAAGMDAGAAYVFRRDQGGANNWGEMNKLTASDVDAGDDYGMSVAISGDIAVVGANYGDARIHNAGAAYVFDLLLPKPPTPTPCLPQGCPTPTITPTETPPPAPLPGDVSCDGTVDFFDAALILQFGAGLLASLLCVESADVNGDGATNSIDAALILQLDAGLLDVLPGAP